MVGVTLRYPYEVRKEHEYFDDVPDAKITKDMLELATHIIETKKGEFDPKKFEDQYEDAVKDLLKKKQAGEKIEAPKQREPANVVNLMEALRRSIDAEGGTKTKQPARSVQRRKGAKKTTSKPHARQRRAS
jgi:DNA end-binding protein Ku